MQLSDTLPPDTCIQAGRIAGVDTSDLKQDRVFQICALLVYAIVLGLGTLHHKMWLDEIQAFVIARDSHSVFELLHNLRYEGHPGLWHLLLYIPAHISWNPRSAQWINYSLGLIEAWLILSERRLGRVTRFLTLFTFFFVYQYGMFARNYMLATLLLTAAVRCLFAERPRRKLAIVFLVLAINSHFLAIPVVAVLAIWMFVLKKMRRLQDIGKVLLDSEFWLALIPCVVSLAIAYFTIKPPADEQTSYNDVPLSPLGFQLQVFGHIWNLFVRLPITSLSKAVAEKLMGFHSWSPLAVVLSLVAILVIIFGALRTRQGRGFFLAVVIMENIALALTVHANSTSYLHFGFIFVSFIFALIIDADADPGKAQHSMLPRPVVTALVWGLLLLQVIAGVKYVADDMLHPNSEAESVVNWLKQTGLIQNPLIVQSNYAVAILGYAELPSVYYSACSCNASYVLWKKGWDDRNRVTREDVQSVYSARHKPVVVLTRDKLTDAQANDLQVKLIQKFLPYSSYGGDSYYVYLQQVLSN